MIINLRPLFYFIVSLLLLLLARGGVYSKQTQAQKNDTLSDKTIQTETIIVDTTNFKTMKSQEEYKIIKHFDIVKFKENNTDGRYEFTDSEGMIVEQEYSSSEYNGEIYADRRRYPNSPYTYLCVYNLDGKITGRETRFYSIYIGASYDYDTYGNIVEEVNEDAPYKFSIDDLIVKMKREYDIDIEDKNRICNIGRYIECNIPLYIISENINEFYENLYLIEGNNGKTLYVKKDNYKDLDADKIYTTEELNETLYEEYKRVKKLK